LDSKFLGKEAVSPPWVQYSLGTNHVQRLETKCAMMAAATDTIKIQWMQNGKFPDEEFPENKTSVDYSCSIFLI
jgi:hypothetical protein